MLDLDPNILKKKGLHMPRQKYQRPTVYATGKREKLWKLEYREYFIGTDGKQHSRHKSKTWSRANFSKSEAQNEADKLIRKLQGGVKADGTMTIEDFWDEVYYPVRSARWSPNTLAAVSSTWKLLKPLYKVRLCDLTKADVDLLLLKLAKAKLRENTVNAALVRVRSICDEALENDYIGKNPAKKCKLPICVETEETRSLTEDEVRKLWDGTEGADYLMWRVLLMTGARVSEVLALTRGDITPDGIWITHSALKRKLGPTKNRKSRVAPIPDSLRSELNEWLSTHDGPMVFPGKGGKMGRRDDLYVREIQDRGRRASGVPDLTFRMCRTTFATLFEGDVKDAQAILGHHSETFTLRVYRKPIASRQLGAVENLDARLRVVPIKRVG